MGALVEVKNLKTYFFYDEGTVKALDGVSFDIWKGKNLGIVGESGCGKSVTAQSILRILGPRGKIVEGEVLLHQEDGSGSVDIVGLNATGPEIRRIRGKDIAMIFQEPMSALSPVHSIGNQVMEPIVLHQRLSRQEARAAAADLLRRVGIPKPDQTLERYPHQLSGGMRQRAMIAMALSCRPRLLIADEPTTALDVTIQAQILDLMKELQNEFGMAIMMITHNLGIIADLAEDVGVMYLGRLVERAPTEELFGNPMHPYTVALMGSIPRGKRKGERLTSIEGAVPDHYNIPRGCPFHPRCPRLRRGLCDKLVPGDTEVVPGHHVSCFLWSEVKQVG